MKSDIASRILSIFRQDKQELKKELRYCLSASRPRKILFDHIPKCGGTSLSLYLEEHYLKRKIFNINGNNPTPSIETFKGLSRHKRYSYDLIKGHAAYKLLDHIHPEHLTITVFREPVDRIISHYYYAKRSTKHYLYSKIHESGMNLEDYASSELSGELRNYYTTRFSGLTSSEAEKNPEESVAKAVRIALERYDIIGFLDDFNTFAKTLQDQANLKHEYANQRANVTKKRPSVDNISRSIIRKIEKVNFLDIVFYRKIREVIG